MQPYTVQIAGGRQVYIWKKEAGRKRSLRLFFLRIKKSRTLIAYYININDSDFATCILYKERRSGLWLKGGEKENGKICGNEKALIENIKKSIDSYENGLGNLAYKTLIYVVIMLVIFGNF
ncbi:MAG: hypothetical protein J0H29_16885 [Sphingobacteriales bacterium]|nr:hypothetical protein [Sphingobacteriales bacterium]OJY86157.1 MAG: hypothetical protein BGP14_16915 [Sphingobacteriales bacterium 44-15]